MKTNDDGAKAIALCAEYARLNSAIKALGMDIGFALGSCPGVNGDLIEPEGPLDWHELNAFLDRQRKDQTHLKEALTPDVDHDGSGIWMEEADITEHVACCPMCSSAWKAIKQRKADRKALGIVKRRITMMGRATAVHDEQHDEVSA